MFKVKTLTIKNFLSIGNLTQAINFDRRDLVLVLGENLDLGGDDQGSRNGTGKTSAIQALSYAFYGQALTSIRKENLINKTNGKGMLVTVEFECNGIQYKIERGRRPAIFKFFKDDVQQGKDLTNEDDDSQGDSRETQKEIEHLLNMSHDMFKNVIALNTYSEPFLAMKANDQRTIIEQLLGITLLSEKADALKELVKTTKELILTEDIRIRSVIEANTRVQEQINSLILRQKAWKNKKDDDIRKANETINTLSKFNIETELALHKELDEFNKQKKLHIDVDKTISHLKNQLLVETKRSQDIIKDLAQLADHKCYACGHALHDTKQEEIISIKQETLNKITDELDKLTVSLQEAVTFKNQIGDLTEQPRTNYSTLDEAYDHKNKLAMAQHQFDTKLVEADPYAEQIIEMQHKAIEEINYDQINGLKRLLEHQEFLLKLLTNKDSFIRKKIIDQNLSYLNSRLGFYLNEMGLPHAVSFNNDLSVSITELGRELDFDNLSRGERTRLILSLSWAFRDVWESLYQPINTMFIDELLDNGLDTSGVESAMKVLKKMSRDRHKSIWLISHKDELTARVSTILHVKKEGGFTRFENDVSIT